MSAYTRAQKRAHAAVQRAVRAGKLLHRPPACCVCFEPGRVGEGGQWSVEYHHHSYEPAFHLDVVPVCGVCHALIHTGTLPEPRTGKYRSPEQQMRHGDPHPPRVLVRRLADGRPPFAGLEQDPRWLWAEQWLAEHPRPRSWPARKAWIQSCPRTWTEIESSRRAA